jgi:hypothetical protein
MPRKWVRDINYWIVRARNSDGPGKTHWNNFALPSNRKPQNRFPGQTHHMYRINLSHNMLINLFRDPSYTPASDPRLRLRLTFREYYEGEIPVILGIFKERLNSVPLGTNADHKDEFHKDAIEYFQGKLQDAITACTNPGNIIYYMKDLYIEDVQNIPVLSEVVRHLHDVKTTLNWICMPFLNYFDIGMQNPLARPDGEDLRIHLEGVTDAHGNVTQMGFENWDYFDFLFFAPSDQNQANARENARDFADEKGFLDKFDVVSHSLQEYGTPHAAGGGNGYQCTLIGAPPNQVRDCVVAPAQYYCVDNNTKICP